MPAVAEVQFKAQGSQQVVSAFNSVGSAAQSSSTKVQQNSTAMSSLGKGMKSSVAGIGQVTTAFATLSLSIVSTWRAYRDLGDAQLAVDRANLKVKKTQEAIKKTTAEIAGLQKAGNKGGLEAQRRRIDLTKLTVALAAAEKKYGKNSLEAKDAALKLKEAQVAGAGSSDKLKAAQAKLEIQQEQLGIAQTNAGEQQERFNDTQQNFYLSILPLGISTMATLTSAFSGFKSMLTGGGGLLGGLGPIGLILGGISLAVLAFKTNFLGLRDAVGGVIDWLKARFGVWKQTLEDVFNFIRKGDWGAAFNKIREAAIAFWADLKKQVPLLTAVETIVNAIRAGKWKYAFDTIVAAAELMWYELKQKVPFFAGAEVFLKQLFGGDLKGAFATLAAGVKTGLETVFGKDAVGGFQEKIGTMINSAKNLFSQFAFDLNKPGGAISQITAGFAKLGQGDIAGGFGGIASGIQTGLNLASNTINNWVLSNFGINLAGLEGSAMAIGNKILDGIKSGLTFVARTWIDPILVALLDPQTWITGFIAMGGFFVKIGTALYTAIGTALGNAAKDPKGTATWWADLGNGIWTGLSDWFTTNVPGATKALQGMAKSLLDAVETAKADFNNLGVAIWNAIVEGIRTLTGGGASPFGGILDTLKKTPIDMPVKPIILAESKKSVIDTIQNYKPPPKVPVGANTAPMSKKLNEEANKITRGGYKVPKIPIDANMAMADAKWKAFMHKVASTQVTIGFGGSGNIRTGSQRGAYGGPKQHGYQSTVHRPTMFLAGEGGRPEDVTVRPRGSVQRGGSGGGGGFYGIINVYVDGVLRPARYDMGARK